MKARRDDGELVGGAARIREDFANLVQQLTSAVDDAANALELPGRQGAEDAVAEDLRVGDDRGERGPEVVRDVGEKLGLRGAQRLELGNALARFLELRRQRRCAPIGGRRRKRRGWRRVGAVHSHKFTRFRRGRQ